VSDVRRVLAIGALGLMLLGFVLGSWHGARVDSRTLLVLREAYAPAFAAQVRGETGLARAALARAQEANLEHTRVIGAHTHVIKLATVLLVIALSWPVLAGSERRKRLLAGALVAGAVLFPVGLLLQAFHPGVITRAVTALGAGLALVSFAAFAAGLLLAPYRDER
jgi:hypothetical protein